MAPCKTRLLYTGFSARALINLYQNVGSWHRIKNTKESSYGSKPSSVRRDRMFSKHRELTTPTKVPEKSNLFAASHLFKKVGRLF